MFSISGILSVATMSVENGNGQQFSPGMTAVINDAYQDAATVLGLQSAHSDRRAMLAKVVIDLARDGVADGTELRDRAVAAIRRLEWIRQQAHEIWESQGRPDGRHAENWAQAEREWTESGGEGLADGKV